jgi:formylglycine-generating enzyme required for sulfatase activity
MKILLLHISAFTLLSSSLIAAPVVNNVLFVQEPDGSGGTQVRVTYDLINSDPCHVSLQFSANSGESFVLNPAALSGDIGWPVEPGTDLEIIWAIADDLSGWNLSSAIARVVATEPQPNIAISEISSTLANGASTNNPNHVITIIFGEPVTGFDISDVLAINATKGTFSGSGSTYTLEISAIDPGPVRLSLPEGVAIAASGTGNTNAPSLVFELDFDPVPPSVSSIFPADGAIITALPSIEVTFSETVTGLTAGQLTVNGSPATTVTGTNPYTFGGFANPGLGTVNVTLAAGSTTDLAGNAYAGDAWSYEKKISLTITSTLAEGSVSETQSQTLTFTFGEHASQHAIDFGPDKVSVTNATKGAFFGSGAVYTLDLTGEGGLIEVEVPANFGHQFTESATFSNFYQDTWTIELQESPLVTMDLIRIPAGTFTMGSPVGELSRQSDETQRTVTLSQDFYLGKTEVTQAQWTAIAAFTGSQAQTFVGSTMPVHNVTWNEIQTWLTALDTAITEPGTFALPTEAQWEYACRAGTTTRFNFGDGFASNETSDTAGGRGDNMWFTGNNSPNGTKAVGQKPANAWGLHDMHGNVWEWCADWYANYPAGPVTDPTGPGSGSARVVRGGGYLYTAPLCRSAQRFVDDPSSRLPRIGFRVLAVR